MNTSAFTYKDQIAFPRQAGLQNYGEIQEGIILVISVNMKRRNKLHPQNSAGNLLLVPHGIHKLSVRTYADGCAAICGSPVRQSVGKVKFSMSCTVCRDADVREFKEVIYNLSSNSCNVFLRSISQIFVTFLPSHTRGIEKIILKRV